ncbi:MAG: aminopeptidase P family protein [Clostridia bacterium]|nr:aminopeptidase P family protein [Clostridia bacterium]
MFNDRIQQLIHRLPPHTAALVTSGASRRYLTGFPSSAGAVLITEQGAWFLIDFRYIEKARETVTSCQVAEALSTKDQIAEYLTKVGATELWIETRNLSLAAYRDWQKSLPEVRVSDCPLLDDWLAAMRAVKSPDELSAIRAAGQITDAAFAHILSCLRPGMTEREVALELEFFMRKNGSEGVAFDTVAVSGKNSSLPHGVPTDKPLGKGDFLTMDFGAVQHGYCFDMTRTVAIGSVSEEQKRVYKTVLAAQNAAFGVLRAGVPGKTVDRAARDVIENAGYHGAFGHSLGHSVGLEIHEDPTAAPRSEALLPAGTVITVEPGIYLAGRFGVRIEDTVFVTADGYENLTHSPKELIIC